MSFSGKKQEYKNGLKSLLSANALLIILFNSTNQYGNTMVSGIMGRYALEVLNISTVAVGVCASLYSLGGLLFRAPSGKLVDRTDPRRILMCALAAKLLVFIGYVLIPPENAVLFGLVRFVHGVTWSFIGVCGPAMLAIYIDRAAIGSAYALFLGIQQIVVSSAKAASISLMDSCGATTAYLVCAAETLIPILLVSLMRPIGRRSGGGTRTDPAAGGAGGKARGFICWRLVPLCLISSLPMMTYAAESNFLPALCEMRELEYLGTLTAATGLSGVISVLVGILCDIVNPYALCILTLLFNGLGLFLIGGAQTSAEMAAALLLYYGLGKSFNAPFTVMGMKSIRPEEAGSFSGTNLFIDDLFTLLAGSVAGFIGGTYGLGASFRVIGCLPLAGVAIMVLFKSRIVRAPR